MIALCSMFAASYAQEKVEQYCELIATGKTFTDQYTAEIIYGSNSLIISSDRSKIKKEFDTLPDALNYMGALGWKLVQSEKPSAYDRRWHFIFKKEFEKTASANTSGH